MNEDFAKEKKKNGSVWGKIMSDSDFEFHFHCKYFNKDGIKNRECLPHGFHSLNHDKNRIKNLLNVICFYGGKITSPI